jgi:hypothetical protein
MEVPDEDVEKPFVAGPYQPWLCSVLSEETEEDVGVGCPALFLAQLFEFDC